MNTALEVGSSRPALLAAAMRKQSREVPVWLAGSAGQTYIQPCATDWEKCPHANEYRDTAISF